MATDKANYYGGKSSGMHDGMKTHSPPVRDSSRKELASAHPVNVGENLRKGVGEVKPATIGPRTA